MRPPCTIPECDKPSVGLGLCRKHYMRQRRRGDTDTVLKGNFIHGEAANRTGEYNTWRSMISRCTNPKNDQYYNYGGKGIKVCDRWLNSYLAFLADVGRRPSPQHSIDRYPDPRGNYEPGNVRWATSTEQTRNMVRNRWITVNGETKCISDWAAYAGVAHQSIRERIKKQGEHNLAQWLSEKRNAKESANAD